MHKNIIGFWYTNNELVEKIKNAKKSKKTLDNKY